MRVEGRESRGGTWWIGWNGRQRKRVGVGVEKFRG